MTIKRIISYGARGAESAALDVAARLDIPHDGDAASGATPGNDAGSHHPDPHGSRHPLTPKTDQGGRDLSEGTLIFTYGPLTGYLDYIQTDSLRRNHRCLHIDFNQIRPLNAAFKIDRWVRRNRIQALFVTGTPLEDDQRVYQAAYNAFYGFLMIDREVHPTRAMKRFSAPEKPWPKTVPSAVRRLVEELSLRDRATIANMSASELPGLNHRLGSYVRNSFGLDSGNQALRHSCAREAGKATVTVEEASAIIIGCLVLELQMTHKLRAL